MSADLAAVRAAFARCVTLGEAIRAGAMLTPGWSVADVIVQDEYTHDIVFASDGSTSAVVLDCT